MIWRHAEKNHQANLKEVLVEGEKGSQPTIAQALKRETETYHKESSRKKALDDALMEMIAADLNPISMVTDAGFRKFCQVADRR